MSGEITRFAPSPTGALHLGHALAAKAAWEGAGNPGGTFLVRMEDIDTTRCRQEFEEQILTDLAWLGFSWPEPVMRQSVRMGIYAAALDKLHAQKLLYPCFCTRQEMAAAASAPQAPAGPVYPGTCRHLTPSRRSARVESGAPIAWRLDTGKAMERAGPLTWHDRSRGTFSVDASGLGDVVLARKDVPVAYHLAVTVDDAAQGVTLVTRGEDLLPSTHIHRLLQSLLELPVPEWRHHRLLCDESGRRLAKRDSARSLQVLREDHGWTPDDVWRAVSDVPCAVQL